mmetsp:Transcript_33661/g.71764  ORF Transcript_33661/g.71764 Transcript_33661/m.71764 type:complete len:100 (-) Transcript_33661:56-355(-)
MVEVGDGVSPLSAAQRETSSSASKTGAFVPMHGNELARRMRGGLPILFSFFVWEPVQREQRTEADRCGWIKERRLSMQMDKIGRGGRDRGELAMRKACL